MQKTFIDLLRASADDRRALFSTVAAALDTHAENVEKDMLGMFPDLMYVVVVARITVEIRYRPVGSGFRVPIGGRLRPARSSRLWRCHKELMFRAPDHRYDRAKPGSYRIVPTADMRTRLEADYRRMSAMIFGAPPAFEEVMASIKAIEHHLNAPNSADVGGI